MSVPGVPDGRSAATAGSGTRVVGGVDPERTGGAHGAGSLDEERDPSRRAWSAHVLPASVTRRDAVPGPPLVLVPVARRRSELMDRPAAPPRTSMFKSYWRILAGHRRGAMTASGLIVFSGVLETLGILSVVPLLSSNDHFSLLGVELHGSALRYWAVAAFAVFGLSAALTRLASERAIIRVVAAFQRDRREELTKAALDMDWASYLELSAGDVNTSLLLTINQISLGVQVFMRSLGVLGVVLVFVAAALGLSWQLSLFTVGFALVALGVYALGSKPTRRHTADLTEAATSLGREADLLFGNLKLFRSLGARRSSLVRMNDIYAQFSQAYVKSQYVGPRTRSIFEITGIVGIAVVLFGAVVGSKGAPLTASSIAFLVLFLRLAPRFVAAQDGFQSARAYGRWCGTWWTTLDAMTAAPARTAGTRSPTFATGLCARAVGFTYPGSPRPVLRDVDWTVSPNQSIAFVGDSGAGKTTMLDLVTGLLEPTSGALTLDGVDLREIDTDRWQSGLGIVMQEPPLLAGTVLDNVYWSEDAQDESRAWHALEQAHAVGFVSRLPDGIHTVLGQRGSTLSGGQRQRLALARALYRDPWLLVLDEPTSALDADAEEEVLRALADVRSSCAMIIVSHNLNPVRLADRVYVLSEGAVVEHGTWEELAGRPDGRFSAMVRRRMEAP